MELMNGDYDVLLLCYELGIGDSEILCKVFRRQFPCGRIVAIAFSDAKAHCPADVTVHAGDPDAMQSSIRSSMESTHALHNNRALNQNRLRDTRKRNPSIAEYLMSQPQEIKHPSEKTSSEEIEIRARAYELFQERRGEHGHDAEDWLRAEEEVHHNRAHRKAA